MDVSKLINDAVCSQRKMKCDSKMPCKNCVDRKRECCVYSRRKKPGRKENLILRKRHEGLCNEEIVKFKRPRPSLEGNMIGYRENEFIDAIFAGFMQAAPVLDEICIRRCMITFWNSPQFPSIWAPGQGTQFSIANLIPNDSRAEDGIGDGAHQDFEISKDDIADLAVLWITIALGALFKDPSKHHL